MKLLVQPGDGIAALVKGIAAAKKSVDIVIFRFDQAEIEHALASAVSRGVAVHALIANTNRAGEENLRRLEMRLLGAGVTVARTADDLIRYHGKFMVIDGRELYVLAYNLTRLDVEHRRSFGVITRSRDLVREAMRLFEADTKRRHYEAGVDRFVVSPANARKQLTAFIRGAKKELAIYDPEVSDSAMIRLLGERAKAGVDVKIIGRLTRKAPGLDTRKLSAMRLHTRTMVRDGKLAFIGSQSLREVELDGRREVGIIFRDPAVVSVLMRVFREDWSAAAQPGWMGKDEAVPAAKVAKKVAKAMTKDLPPVAPLLDGAVKEIVGEAADVNLRADEVQGIVREAIKEAVKEVVREVVEEAVGEDAKTR